MNFKNQDYIQQFLAAAQAGKVFNDAESYGVEIQPAEVADGALYWRAIGVHHLLPKENERSVNVFVEAIDEQGRRIRQGKVLAGFTWEGRKDDPDVKALDKGDADPMGGDFNMGAGTHLVWIHGERKDREEPSDRVVKLHTRHDDEPFGDPDAGNTFGHHSFFVVFQRTRKGPTVLDPDAMRAAARRLRDEQIDADTTLAAYAREHELGAPVTPEFSAGGYQGRGFEKAIVFAPLTDANQIEHTDW